MTERAPVVEAADGIHRIPLATGAPGNPFSSCYALEGADGGLALLDPGIDTDANWTALCAGLSEIGRSVDDVASVTATHLHIDHIGLADRIRSASGATVALHVREQAALDVLIAAQDLDGEGEPHGDEWGVPLAVRTEFARGGPSYQALTADRLLAPGERLPVAGRDLAVLPTPGHTPGHICLVDRGARLLFTGDHVLGGIYPGIGLGGPSERNPIADYLDSLDLVEPLDVTSVLPGHDQPVDDLAARVEQIRAHHLHRAREVAAALDRAPGASVYEIAATLTWTLGWSGLRGFYLLSAIRQTALFVDYVRSPAFRG